MTEDTNSSIRRTWAIAVLQREALGARFYAALFRRAPEVRSLFKPDMQSQQMKLVDTLNYIVDHLDDQQNPSATARDLAIRHVAYGARPEHYDAVGASLLEALASILGPEFDASARQAWAETYADLSRGMIEAAYPQP